MMQFIWWMFVIYNTYNFICNPFSILNILFFGFTMFVVWEQYQNRIRAWLQHHNIKW